MGIFIKIKSNAQIFDGAVPFEIGDRKLLTNKKAS